MGRGTVTTIWGSILLLVGIALAGATVVMPTTRVTVSTTTATAEAGMTKAQCQSGSPLKITIPWHGRVATVQDDSPPCDRDYRPGDQLAVYIGSDSPDDVGPSGQWILDPASHDSFDFIAPNDLRGMVGLLAGATLISDGLIWFYVWKLRTRPRPTTPYPPPRSDSLLGR